MEHFEVHKENLEDLIIDLDKNGPKVLVDIPALPKKDPNPITIDDLALIDELSGLTLFVDNFMMTNDLSEAAKARLEARILRYNGEKPKEIALNEMRMKIYGDGR